MKKSLCTALGIALCLSFSAPVTGHAQMPGVRDSVDNLTGCDARREAPAFSQVDIDRDGKINYREIKSADRADAQAYEKMDTDKDGFISRQELQAQERARGGCVN